MKVLIGMPVGSGAIPVEMVKYLMSIQTIHDISMTFPVRLPIATARNKIINYAIENNFDYIWWLDDDNPPELPNALDILLESGEAIVSGCVPSRLRHKDGKYKLCIFDRKEPSEYGMRHQMDELPDTFQTIANCGCGCCIMSVEALKKLVQVFPHPCESALQKYYDVNGEWINGQFIQDPGDHMFIHNAVSEDLILMEKLQFLGYKVYAEPRVCCKHQFNGFISVSEHILCNSTQNLPS